MNIFYLLTAAICAAYLQLILSYLRAWNRAEPGAGKPGPGTTRVSVVIPARNEAHNIGNCLSAILSQKYPQDQFEVIVVDDHSTDGTRKGVTDLQRPNVKVLVLSSEKTGKKQALSEGIRSAAGDLIVTTDADCEMGENWLSSIVSFYEEKKRKMIVAPVLLKGESTFQQILQGQEMTVLTACACASIRLNHPILCSGANLAYEKSAFLAVNGFDGVDGTATGDDIFLMLKMHARYPKEIGYLRAKDAIVYTHAEATSSNALKQRKRWASKTLLYGFNNITGIAVLIFLTNFLILFSGIISAINLKFVLVPAICFLAKFLVDLMLVHSASSFFGKKFSPAAFMIFSLIYPLYVSLTGLISPFTHYSWKGRTSGI